MKKLLTILLLINVAHAQLSPFMPVFPSAAPVTHDSITIQFRSTNTTPATGVTAVMYGNPHSAVLTYTNATYGITVSTVSTANWASYSGCSCSSVDAIGGATGGTYFPGVGNSAYTGDIFTYGPTVSNYNASKWQLEITGLNPSTTYTIGLTGMDGTQGFDGNPFRFRVSGATSPAYQDVNGDVTNQTGGATFTLQSDATGKIKCWGNSVSGEANNSDYCAFSILKIKW